MLILIIGATGMLGRPVARRLAADGFRVRALVRDPARARPLLPEQCDLAVGDVRDRESLERAMRGCDAVHTNLSHPYSPREPFDPDRDGTPLILDAARRAGIKRLVRISAMGVPEARREWWLVERKAAADELVMSSSLAATVLRPTWLMESLPLFIMGPLMLKPMAPKLPLWWISGDDYARGVAAVLRSDRAIGRAYIMQGPQPLTFAQAIDRFVAAWPRRLFKAPLPRLNLRLGRLLSARAGYLDDLLTMTFRHTARFESQAAWDDLGRPTMTIEDYARYIQQTGDVPRK